MNLFIVCKWKGLFDGQSLSAGLRDGVFMIHAALQTLVGFPCLRYAGHFTLMKN